MTVEEKIAPLLAARSLEYVQEVRVDEDADDDAWVYVVGVDRRFLSFVARPGDGDLIAHRSDATTDASHVAPTDLALFIHENRAWLLGA